MVGSPVEYGRSNTTRLLLAGLCGLQTTQLIEAHGDLPSTPHIGRDHISHQMWSTTFDAVTLQVRFCEGGREYRVTGIPAATLQRVIGTVRRECLDWLIPMSEGHLRSILKSWVEHYNRGRPHSSLGPGVPDPPQELALIPKSESRHRLAVGALVLAKSVLAGLHHEYVLATAPASA